MSESYSLEKFSQGQLLLIDKPLKLTSFQVVKKVRYLIKKKYKIKKIKVGHAGTLDPLASGLLLICTGKFTKRIQEFQELEKEYTGTFTFGGTTPSFDLETEIDNRFSIDHLTPNKLSKAAQSFIGDTAQYPPIYSALKRKGKRLYEYARAGEQVKITPRTISISEFELKRIALPEVDFRVKCSKGTYIRSLANDMGKKLDSGAYLSALRRTKIGAYTVENALTIDQFAGFLVD